MAVPVWGRASAGAEVTVTLDGTTVATEADAGGAWRVELPARGAGGPYAMTVASGDQTRWMVVVR